MYEYQGYKTLPSLTLFASSPPSSPHRSLPRTAGGYGWRTGTRSRPPSPEAGTADDCEKRDAINSFSLSGFAVKLQVFKTSDAYHTSRNTGTCVPHNLTAQPGKSVNRFKASYNDGFGTARIRNTIAAEPLAQRSVQYFTHNRCS